MYLNFNPHFKAASVVGLTLTWDVFKSICEIITPGGE